VSLAAGFLTLAAGMGRAGGSAQTWADHVAVDKYGQTMWQWTSMGRPRGSAQTWAEQVAVHKHPYPDGPCISARNAGMR